MPPEYITLTRDEVAILQKQMLPDGCIACDRKDGGPHDYDCAWALGLESIPLHRDIISTFALASIDNPRHVDSDTRCLLCGRIAYWPDEMCDRHDGCSLEGVRV